MLDALAALLAACSADAAAERAAGAVPEHMARLEVGRALGAIFQLAAAWNGGPGNLNKWRRRVDDMGDPLFFIERLPSRETRNFIEHVLTNLWIYRNRLGQDAPSLDAVASGAWPSYNALGQEPRQVASNVEN